MKKKKLILITVISVIVLLCVCVGIVLWQGNNFMAVYYSMSYSDDDIDKLMSENNDDVKKYIDSNSQYNVRPTDEVEEKLHQAGAITDSELVGIITGKESIRDLFGIDVGLSPNKNFVNPDDGKVIAPESLVTMKETLQSSDSDLQNQSNPGESGDKSDVSDKGNRVDNSGKISECIANLYVLKSSFVGRLDALYSEAVSYYKSMPASERKNAKSEILKMFYSKGSALEAECDSQVASLMAELKTLLNEEGSDLTLISKIQSAYDNEKSLKKAQYLNKL